MTRVERQELDEILATTTFPEEEEEEEEKEEEGQIQRRRKGKREEGSDPQRIKPPLLGFSPVAWKSHSWGGRQGK